VPSERARADAGQTGDVAQADDAGQAERERLAARQAEFLDSLQGRGPSPPGFDGDDLSAAAASLLRKRLGAVTRDWPALAHAAGETLPEAFAQYAQSTPPPVTGEGLADGLGFALSLDPATLSDAARVELVHARARFAVRQGRVTPRRGAFAGALRLRHPTRVLVVLRLPGLGIGHFHLGRTSDW
jgi:hypothetical protein